VSIRDVVGTKSDKEFQPCPGPCDLVDSPPGKLAPANLHLASLKEIGRWGIPARVSRRRTPSPDARRRFEGRVDHETAPAIVNTFIWIDGNHRPFIVADHDEPPFQDADVVRAMIRLIVIEENGFPWRVSTPSALRMPAIDRSEWPSDRSVKTLGVTSA
jgi:hypothetical protein